MLGESTLARGLARHRAWLVAGATGALGLALSFAQVQSVAIVDIRSRAIASIFSDADSSVGDPLPSIVAARRLRDDDRAPIYDSFGITGASFIYPPLSAIYYAGLVDDDEEEACRALTWVNHVLFIAIAGCALALVSRRNLVRPAEVAGVLVCATLFYPITRAVELNQTTVAICAALGVATLAARARMSVLAGVALALAISTKPQLVLVLPFLGWHARRVVWVALSACIVLAVISVVFAGIENHVAYLTRVLPVLSRGYFFYPNQSWNGFFNRLFIEMSLTDFSIAQPNVWVRVCSSATSVATLALGGFAVWRVRLRVIDPAWVLMFAWLVVTLASPISWEHHYAPALLLFALWYTRLRDTAAGVGPWEAVAVGLSFALIAGYFEVRTSTGALERLAVSYVFYGGLALAGLTGRALSSIPEVVKT